ncbi:6-phosphogluconolactonase [Qipengyuania nanhaisediminis]|uniref:6-phosphogluconolactonase n=1 Tax=Qipengyuania nanhaisediminis TaxID=604088 RepID=A0A1I5LGK3_9SPHN|nr:6-phosphogluconolactonase [Qipengyuania nanhaisediminis]SFO96430.1 6-phosphogluconolactonase [Qipengyuania nanhaisediminis]
MADVTIIERASDEAIADWLAARLSEAMDAGEGPVTITVPGGSTPFPIIEKLLEHDLDFSRLVVWPNDDRIVPEDHEASNTGKLRALFEPAGAEVVTLTIMEAVPHFDLAWLGMGADGHIASLFPNTDPQIDEERRIIRLTPDPLPPEAPFDRISLTLPSLLDSAQIAFVIRGSDKRTVFDDAVSGQSDLPVARLLKGASQPVTCFT